MICEVGAAEVVFTRWMEFHTFLMIVHVVSAPLCTFQVCYGATSKPGLFMCRQFQAFDVYLAGAGS